MAQTDFQ